MTAIPLYCRDGQVGVFPPNEGTKAMPCSKCGESSVWHRTYKQEAAK